MRESVNLDTKRLGVLTGQYVQAIRLCSTVRRFKEAIQKVTAAAMRRGYSMREQKRTWTKFPRPCWGAQEVVMGEMEVWFGRMTNWVRAELQKEEVKQEGTGMGGTTRRRNVPTPTPKDQLTKTWEQSLGTQHHNHGHNRRQPIASRITTTRVGQ